MCQNDPALSAALKKKIEKKVEKISLSDQCDFSLSPL